MGSIYFKNCPIKNGSAYQRSTIPGTMPRKTLDESGNQVDRPIKKLNTYFIYIQLIHNCDIETTRIWIGGKAYRIAQEVVTHTPVVIEHSHPGALPDTLVKQTGNKVIRLQPTEELQVKSNKMVRNKLGGGNVVIEYNNNSRSKYYIIKEIKKLAPLVLQ